MGEGHKPHTDGLFDWESMAYTTGGGVVEAASDGYRLAVGPCIKGRYQNAQLDDYHRDGRFRWQPPLSISLWARFEQPATALRGTAGFGFWNDPLGMTGRFRLRPPQAVWFFLAGAPNDLSLVLGSPGQGWRGAVISAARWSSWVTVPWAMLPAALLRGGGWMRRAGDAAWQYAADALQLDGRDITVDVTAWCSYAIDWLPHGVTMRVDGAPVFSTPFSPPGPLGLVIWIDNQFMVLNPRRLPRAGTVESAHQGLLLRDLAVAPGAPAYDSHGS